MSEAGEGSRVRIGEVRAAQVAAARQVAADLMAYNPNHGDFLTAGRMVMEAIDAAGEAASPSLEEIHANGHYGCVHSIGHCNHPEWD